MIGVLVPVILELGENLVVEDTRSGLLGAGGVEKGESCRVNFSVSLSEVVDSESEAEAWLLDLTSCSTSSSSSSSSSSL